MNVLGTKETAEKIGMKPSYLSFCLSTKQYDRLPPFYKRGRSYLFDESDVDAWLQERRVDVYAEKRKQQKGE